MRRNLVACKMAAFFLPMRRIMLRQGIRSKLIDREHRRQLHGFLHQRPLRFNRHAVRLCLRRLQWAFIDNQYAYMEATKHEREYLFSSMGVHPDVYKGVRS